MLANRMMMCMNKRKIDHSTPVTVVNSAYTTSATARPQHLSNGWIVTAEMDASRRDIYLHVSEDNGVTWNQLCWVAQSDTHTCFFALTSYGTKVYLLKQCGYSTATYLAVYPIETTTQTNINIISMSHQVVPNASFTDGSGCSIAVSSTGELTVACSDKTPTYSSSFNIRSAKSIDGGVTWTKQDGAAGVDQLYVFNTSGNDSTNPYVQYDKNNKPILFFQQSSNGYYEIYCFTFNGTSWSTPTIIVDVHSYSQYNPIATLSKDNTIHCTWYGGILLQFLVGQ